MFYIIKCLFSKYFLKNTILSGMKTNTQDSLARIKEEDLENGKGYTRQDCWLKPRIREEMLREDLASVCMCIYSLPSSIKVSVDICFTQVQVSNPQ